jgi:hypothetical protein
MAHPGISAELLTAGPLRQLVIAFAGNADFRSEIFSSRKEIESEQWRSSPPGFPQLALAACC